jgi:hypothetical protein
VQTDDVGLGAILEEHAELHARCIRRGNERVGALDAHVERLLGEHMDSARRGTNPLLGVKPGRASDRNDIERRVGEERVEIRVGDGIERRCQPFGACAVGAVHRHHFDAGNRGCRARMRLADVARAKDAHVDRHAPILSLSFKGHRQRVIGRNRGRRTGSC